MTATKPFNPRSFTAAPQQIQKKAILIAPVERVWEVIANHQGMTEWVPMIKEVHLVTPDTEGAWGEGCERHCQFGPDLLKEKIVHWDPPYGYAYAIGDMHLVRDHVGYIQLIPTGDKTEVIWTQYFHPNGNFVKNFMAKNIMMPSVMSKALKNAAKLIA